MNAEMILKNKLLDKLSEALAAVLPIVVLVLFLSMTVAPIPSGVMLSFLLGAACTAIMVNYIRRRGLHSGYALPLLPGRRIMLTDGGFTPILYSAKSTAAIQASTIRIMTRTFAALVFFFAA